MSKQKQQDNKKFWQFKNAAGTEPPELILYGDISDTSWWGDEVTPKQFSDDLNALGNVPEIIVRINSGGGDVFAAVTIYTRLKSHKAKITVKIDGWAASAATIICMAGDVIQIPAAGAFMIHDPAVGILFAYFTENELVKLENELKVVKNSIINAYALKTGKDKEEISALMSAETWFTGEDAVAAGFCDEVLFQVNAVDMFAGNMADYKNMPYSVRNSINKLPLEVNQDGNFLYINKQSNENNQNSSKGEKAMEIKNVDELRATYPDLVGQIEDNAVLTERKRIQDIENIAIGGFENLVNDAKFTNPINSGDLAVKIIAEQKKRVQIISVTATRTRQTAA